VVVEVALTVCREDATECIQAQRIKKMGKRSRHGQHPSYIPLTRTPCSFMTESPTHTSMNMSQLSQIPHDQSDYRVRANRTFPSASNIIWTGSTFPSNGRFIAQSPSPTEKKVKRNSERARHLRASSHNPRSRFGAVPQIRSRTSKSCTGWV
jgi:hypothetical protein